MDKSLLFIFNLIPEETHYFEVPLDHPLINDIIALHGIVFNSDEVSDEQWVKFDRINVESSENEFDEPKIPGKDLSQYKVPEKELQCRVFHGVSVIGFLC